MSDSIIEWGSPDQHSKFSGAGADCTPSTQQCYSNRSEHDMNVYEGDEQDFEQDHKSHEHFNHFNQHTYHSINRPVMYTPHGQGKNASNYPGHNDSDDAEEDIHYRAHQEMDAMMENDLGLIPRNQANAYNASFTYNANANMAPYQYYSNVTAIYGYPAMQSPVVTSPNSTHMNSNPQMMHGSQPQYANTPQSMNDPRFSNSPQRMQPSPYRYSPYPMHGIQYPITPSSCSPQSSDRRDSYQPVKPDPSAEPQETQEMRPTPPGFKPLPPFESIESPIIPTNNEEEVNADGDVGIDGDSEMENEMDSESPKKTRRSLPARKSTAREMTAKGMTSKFVSARPSTPTALTRESSTRPEKLSSEAAKKHHNEVEKSYRIRLNSCIDELSITIYGSPKNTGACKSRSSASVFKHSKAIVIAAAKSNIEDLRHKNAKLTEENEALKRKLLIYEHKSKSYPSPDDNGNSNGGGPGSGNCASF